MKPIDAVGSQPGRVLGLVAGSVMIAWGDVCLLGPLVHGPLRGRAVREQRASDERPVSSDAPGARRRGRSD